MSELSPVQHLRFQLNPHELDREFSIYLNVSEQFRDEVPGKLTQDALADYRWKVAQELLKMRTTDLLMNIRLSYVGMSLADFLPEGYNNGEVARDSDGSRDLNQVA